MNKFCLCLLVFALLAVPAAAQFVYIPDNNPASGGANSWPFNFSSTTGRFIQILNASFLPNAPVKITEVAFSKSSTVTQFTAKQFQMRMSHTTVAGAPSNTFANNFAPCPTNLIDTMSGFSYSVPSNNTWTDIGTTCDFGYDGVRNICLEIRYRGQITSLGFPCRSGTVPRAWSNSTTIDNYNAPTSVATSTSSGLKVRLTLDRTCVMIAPDTGSIGTSIPIQCHQMPAGSFYQIAASLGQSPFNIGNHTLCLDFDNVFFASVFVGPPVFNNYSGIVPATGTVTAKFAIPAIKALVGTCVYHAALAFDTSGVKCTTNTAGTQLTP